MNDVKDKLGQMQEAYKQLYLGSLALLEIDSAYWTEKLLLKLVHHIAKQRLGELRSIPFENFAQEKDAKLRESMIWAAAEASLGGHELDSWEKVENGYQATCRLCKGTTWIGWDGLRYTLLDDECV